jgi:hypothetical protein
VHVLTTSERRPWTAPVTALTAVVLLVAGCGGSDSSGGSDSDGVAAAGETTPAASSGSASDLMGTWQTPDIPLERVRANFLAAGGTPEQAAEFLSTSDAKNTVSFLIEVGDDSWVELESDDGRPAVTGWRGNYTADAKGVHAHELGTTCAIDYATALDDQGRLRIEVVRDEGADPACGAIDLLAQKTIYESAPFSLVP